MIRLLPLLALGLAACAAPPMTEARAEALCKRDVGLADGVAGRVRVGGGSAGASAGVGIVLTDRVFNPQTPQQFMAQCIDEKMGRAPVKTRVGIRVGAST